MQQVEMLESLEMDQWLSWVLKQIEPLKVFYNKTTTTKIHPGGHDKDT